MAADWNEPGLSASVAIRVGKTVNRHASHEVIGEHTVLDQIDALRRNTARAKGVSKAAKRSIMPGNSSGAMSVRIMAAG